ncbi:MAG: family 78 glycoside hydrolase catalytic domain [Bacteroidales bacterium]|nr:family 78 glycoside hydrolase catalytic domain [Bacteroidales bacterium]
MKNFIACLAFVFLLLSCGGQQSTTSAVKVQHLTCEHRENPIGVGLEQQRFSWQIQTDLQDVKQEAYRILVASSKEKLEQGEADIWDSGKQASSASVLVDYEGPALKTSTYYYWKVQVWTNRTQSYSESPVAYFLTALRTEKDWGSSRWIGYDNPFPWDDESTHARLSARYLRKDFFCAKEVKQAVLHIAGLGLYELWLNGEKVGDQVMAPVPTDYRRHIMYNTFDVTEHLQEGANAVGVILGNGRYYAMRQNYKTYKWNRFGYPKMRMRLFITYTDGRTQTLQSDQTWQLSAQGPIVSNNEFDGEEYDARKEFEGWSMPGFQTNSAWMPAQRVTIPIAPLVAQPCNNMKVMTQIKPKSITKLNANTYIMDMGLNMTGWIKMNVKGKRGQEVKLRFAEALLPDGSLSMANLRDALVTDKYILKGDAEGETWAPRFVTHGFQFVEITNYPGVPQLEDFVGEFVCDEMADLGSFESSSPILNATYTNAYWGIRGNYKGMPVDCPQRNERMPWLGDRVMGSYGESFLFNNAAFYAKWMDDIRDAQRWDGAIPDVAPAYWNYYSDDITWPAALFMTCDMLYRQYGDLAPVAKHIDGMKKYMDYMRQYYYHEESGLMTADKYGDWCMPTESLEIIHSQAPDRLTDGRLIATAYFYALYQLMIKYADLLDQPQWAEGYAAYAESLKEAFHRNFFQEDKKCYSNNTVTANILALAMGFVPQQYEEAVCENIREKIMVEYKGTMASGIIGNQWLWRELTHRGYGDIAYLLATTTDYPSFGYMVTQGATTIWELWNGDKANPKMNSRNHVMQLGDLLIWCYEDLAGIKSDEKEVAFKKIIMKPAFDIKDLNYVKASYETPYGLVKSAWNKSEAQTQWQVSIPANASAEISIPAQLKTLRVNGANYARSGAKCLSKNNQQIVLSLPSGNYDITW